MIDTSKMTLEQIRKAGMEALIRELGPVGMIRFLQQFDMGSGDYTKERHKIFEGMDVDAIVEKIKQQRIKDSK
jgi:hypothetical protein